MIFDGWRSRRGSDSDGMPTPRRPSGRERARVEEALLAA
jgi:hypothetical protein